MPQGGTVSPSSTTPLASTEVNHDVIEIQLVEPVGMPSMVKIVWPPQPSIVNPKRFGEVAASLVRLFSEAHVTLARIKAQGR
jgi:hypothetical protein